MKSRRSKNQDEFMAAAIGDLEWLKQSLREKSNYTEFDENGLSAIHLTSIHGRFDCLKYLIEEIKVDVNLASAHGWRPIHLCINNKIGKRALEIMLYLMHKGAVLSICNEDGLTPVHQAASEGHIKCLNQLIEAGAPFTTLDNRSNRPIDLAKLWGHKECAKLLATHSWHKDKAALANEKFEIKKWQIREILCKLEKSLETTESNRYKGSQAFMTWLGENTNNKSDDKVKQSVVKQGNEDEKKSKNGPTPPDVNEKKVPLCHPTPWNAAVRSIETFSPYPGSLRDLYPRNLNTLEPFWWSSPGELNPKSKEPLAQLLVAKDQKLIRKAAQERSGSKANPPSKLTSAKTSDRMMYYKSDSVMDIPSKNIPKSAALQRTNDSAFCFTNDIDSGLFRGALNFELFGEASTCPSTASTDISQFMGGARHQGCYSADIMTLDQ